MKYLKNNYKQYEDNSKFIDIDESFFELPANGLSKEKLQRALSILSEYMNTQKKNFLGYQVNDNMDYEQDLKQYLNIHINNVGDPFTSGNLTTNSKFIEKPLLDYYARLWHAKRPHSDEDKESYWGYSLSMGSTEGNVYAIWNARDYLSGKVLLIDDEAEKMAEMASRDGRPARVPEGFIYYKAKAPKENPNAYIPVAFYSQDAHYSIVKAMRVLNFQTFYTLGSEKYECPLKYPEDYPEGFSIKYLGKNKWPLEVPSNSDGSICIPAYSKLVEFFVSKGYPIFTCFNYGSTFKGAYDQVQKAINSVVSILKKYNMYEREVTYEINGVKKKAKRNGFWFHVDGALGAAYMPFIEMAMKERLKVPEGYEFPIFDFRIPEVNSIVMSGHKWIGAPFPCGIYMTKVKYQLLPPDDPMYIGAPDTTFAGSRNGLAAIVLWDYAAKHSYSMQIEKVFKTENLAKYTVGKLQQLQARLASDLWVERSPLSLTIRFKKPSDNIIYKYSLSCETLYVNGEKRSYAHIYAMEHVTYELIDNFILDLSQEGAFPDQKDELEKEEFSNAVCGKNGSDYIHMMGRGLK
jgi:histidine decarboxylase